MSLFDDIVLNDKKFHCMWKTFEDRTWDLLGSKVLWPKKESPSLLPQGKKFPLTLRLDVPFLLYVNFDKFTIESPFFSYIFYTCEIFKRSKINYYVINQLFKLQVFVVKNYA